MHIDRIISQERRDFTALFRCEHCSATEQKGGYDDAYFHQKVIPVMTCKKCGKTADLSYRPLSTKYPEGMVV